MLSRSASAFLFFLIALSTLTNINGQQGQGMNWDPMSNFDMSSFDGGFPQQFDPFSSFGFPQQQQPQQQGQVPDQSNINNPNNVPTGNRQPQQSFVPGIPRSPQQQQSFVPQSSQQQPQSFAPQNQQQQPQQSFMPAFPGSPQQQQAPQSFMPGVPQNPQQQQFRKQILNIFKKIPGLNANGGFNPFNPSQGGSQINIPGLDLSNITSQIGKGGFFFDQNPFYRRAVFDLKKQLLDIRDPAVFADTVSKLEDSPDLNRQVWLRASIGAAINRPDITSFQIPSLLEVNPGFVLPTEAVSSVGQQVSRPQAQRQCVVLDGSTGSDNGPENTFWYFREDVMVNSHHWFWHLYYPMIPIRHADRRGELFYAMHHELLQRYNAERLGNGFNRVVPFVLQRGAIINEGYRPHLTNIEAGVPWGDRPSNIPLADNIRSFTNFTLADALTNHGRILQAINTGVLIMPQGNGLSLNTLTGIDTLADTAEATVFSANPTYYGRLGHHNTGHVFIANSADPSGRTPPGVMSETATAMRDILFYRWHAGIDELFSSYKDRLAAYQPAGGELPLGFPGVFVDSIQVISSTSGSAQTPNQLRTFWNSRTISLDNGLDFFRDPNAGSVPVCVRHLDHDPFQYRITIRKDPAVQSSRAAIRIFLAPRLNENGQRYTMAEQRRLFFTMDVFSVNLQNGPNTFVRNSIDSTVTIAWPQSLNELNSDQNRTRVYCGCGWPEHLLVPRGTPTGMAFDLFVMVTNEIDGAIPFITTVQDDDLCEMSYVLCGIRNQNYPDTKPMGYPFDRLPYSIPAASGSGTGARVVANLDEYVQGLPNTATTQIRVVHQA